MKRENGITRSSNVHHSTIPRFCKGIFTIFFDKSVGKQDFILDFSNIWKFYVLELKQTFHLPFSRANVILFKILLTNGGESFIMEKGNNRSEETNGK